ncbi:helix-turn-helix domain-containing protein [Streptomyces sp. NPDC090025]|uniref:helix-turn-helix domain-containing protein n=1 Tax=Streptomyces sp. NPDC090025 TaxID=3365922 RepID=UPI0038351F18
MTVGVRTTGARTTGGPAVGAQRGRAGAATAVRRRVCAVDGRCQWFYGAPDARLRPGVGVYRGYRSPAGVPQERLVVPTGRVSLLIGFGGSGGRLRVHGATGRASGASLVSGLHTRARVLDHGGDLHGVEVTLTPWTARRIFDAPLADLADTLLDPADVLGPQARHLADALADAPDWPARFALLDAALLRWNARAADGGRAGRPDPAVLEAWRLLERASGDLRVRDLAAATGWSPRHLQSRFQAELGLSPKQLAQVLRLGRAVRELSAGTPAAAVATRCGFYDQAHLSRAFNGFTGLPPGRFLARRAAASAWLAG